jgi:hypothetical protein
MTLDCYKNQCNGTLARCKARNPALYECAECGAGINQDQVEQLSGGTGPVGQLATALLQYND